MAITWENIKGALKRAIGGIAGEPRMVVTRTAGPSSYSTGGFDYTVGELSEIIAAFVIADSGYLADIDFANSNKNTLRIRAYYFDYDASADAAAIEVAAGTDLSGVNFVVIAFGW